MDVSCYQLFFFQINEENKVVSYADNRHLYILFYKRLQHVFTYQSVSGESITKSIFIFLAAGDPLGGRLASSFESFRALVGELGLAVRSLSREGRKLLKFTPPEIFSFCKNSMFSMLPALEVCVKCLKVQYHSKNSSNHTFELVKYILFLFVLKIRNFGYRLHAWKKTKI